MGSHYRVVLKSFKESSTLTMLLRPSRLACLLIAAANVTAADRPARYTAMLADGQRLEGNKLRDWHDEKALPLLDGQPLLASANPLRWLRDRSQPMAASPEAYVELTNGDRLPGVVTDYRTGLEEPFDPQPPHLIVHVAISFEPPENRPVAEIRVATQFVRRIVWQRREGEPHEAGTAVYRDGRSLGFRSIRFQAGEVHLLLADGDRRIDWSELAELDLPALDPWTSWFDQLAAVCPTASTRLIEIETSTGLVATASLARLAARFEGNSSDADRWVHGVQPAWSLDILWIPFHEIACYRTFSPQEVPLSQITPRGMTRREGLGGSRNVEINRSAKGTPLRSMTRDFGWGVGAHGGTDVAFDLPPCECSLRTSVCLDREAGRGGCIRPRIFDNDSMGKPLWEGPVIVGSETIVETGPIKLAGPAGGQRLIVLQLDPVITGRPSGADPLDIRDFGDWCDPLLELDQAFVQAELDKRLPKRFAAWREWTIEPGGELLGDAGLQVAFHRNDELPGSFETSVSVRKLPLVLRRELKLGAEDKWLIIAARRLSHGGETPKIEVRIGERVTALSVPSYQSNPQDVSPLAVPLSDLQQNTAETISVEIRQMAAEQTAGVHYRAVTVAPQLPTLFRALHDREQASGAAVTPGGRFRIELPSVVRVRAAPKWGEVRLIRFAIKKQGGGQVVIELEDDQPRERPARYDLGPGGLTDEPVNRIWQAPLPNDWIVLTRDLFADFGNIDLKAITLTCEGGDAASIGSLDLARTQADLELASPVGPASGL